MANPKLVLLLKILLSAWCGLQTTIAILKWCNINCQKLQAVPLLLGGRRGIHDLSRYLIIMIINWCGLLGVMCQSVPHLELFAVTQAAVALSLLHKLQLVWMLIVPVFVLLPFVFIIEIKSLSYVRLYKLLKEVSVNFMYRAYEIQNEINSQMDEARSY